MLDPDGLALPGATVVITNAATGFTREAITADTGAYSVPNLEPGTYDVAVTMAGFGNATRTGMVLAPGSAVTLELKLTVAGVQENLVVTGESPLVERTSNQIGGSLSRREIEEVPSNFRNFTGLTQLIPGMTPNPATSTFEGGQVVANGSPSQQNVYLLDGMYNNDDRLGGSQGTQVRVVLDNIEEYQVLANQYSSEYGGGAGAIINMVTRGGTNDIRGRVYSYFRDETLNARGKFLPDGQPKPPERTLQAGFGLGGPIVRNRAHFYFTYERDNEDIAGQKRFPPAAAPLAVDQVGFFTVRANNYFARADLQLNDRNFINGRWLLEDANVARRGLQHQQRDPRRQGVGGRPRHAVGRHLHQRAHRPAVERHPLRAHRRIADHGAAGLLQRRRRGDRLRRPRPVLDRPAQPARQLHHRHRRHRADHGHPQLRHRPGVQLLRPQPVRRRAHRQGRRRLQLEQHGPALDLRLRDLPVPWRRALQPGRSRRRIRSSSTSPSARRDDYGYAVVSKDQRRYVFVEDKWSLTSNVTLNLGPALGQPRADAQPQQRLRAARRLRVGRRAATAAPSSAAASASSTPTCRWCTT